jgi:hypothetical protein
MGILEAVSESATSKEARCNFWYTASMDLVFSSEIWGKTGNSDLYIHSSLSEKTGRRRRG